VKQKLKRLSGRTWTSRPTYKVLSCSMLAYVREIAGCGTATPCGSGSNANPRLIPHGGPAPTSREVILLSAQRDLCDTRPRADLGRRPKTCSQTPVYQGPARRYPLRALVHRKSSGRTSTDRVKMPIHVRQGHWRHQRVGPERKQVRMVLIPLVVVNAGSGLPVVERVHAETTR
jgi:hypothetical protein